MTYDVIDRARRTTRRRVAALVAVAVAALVAVGAGMLLTGRQPPAGPGGADPTSATTIGTGAAGPADRVLPTDLTFAEVSGVRLPVSGSAGPRETSGGLARGFSHDQAGAVLAAVHLLVRVAPQVGPAVFDPTLRTQVVGPDADAMRAQVGRDYEDLRSTAGVAYGQPVGRLSAALRGFQVSDYSPQETGLRVLTESAGADGAAVLVGCIVRMRWTGSDWALVAPPGGTFNSVVAVVTPADADGFRPFSEGR